MKYKLVQIKEYDGDPRYIDLGFGRIEGNRGWIKLESLPIPNKDGEVWINLFERKANGVQETDEERLQ